MLNLKKTAVAVLAFSSSAVFAGSMGPVCSAVNVTVPCESTAWELGARALYLNSSLGQVQLTVNDAAGQSVNSGLNPKYGWGFFIEGAYHFSTGNDLNLNWYHINNGYSKISGPSSVTNIPGSGAGTSPLSLSGVTVDSGYASSGPHWDAVNLEMGQHVDFGENKSVRFHGGFEYARLAGNNTLEGTGTVNLDVLSTTVPVAYNMSLTNQPTYNGFGPRLGTDFNYDWGNGLGMYANGAMGLLAGSSKSSALITDVTNGDFMSISSSKTIVVPELEGKLGLNYNYATAQGDLTLDIGWMWVNYFNVIKDQSTPTNNTDFSLQGPYIGLKWMGNVA